VDEVCSDRCKESRRPATVALASLKEEAGAEYSSLCESVSYGSSNRGLSGARYSLQPEYTITVRVVGLCICLHEKGFPCLRIAFVVVLVNEIIKGSPFSGMQLSENHFLVDI
jgi:hypothetical protein